MLYNRACADHVGVAWEAGRAERCEHNRQQTDRAEAKKALTEMLTES